MKLNTEETCCFQTSSTLTSHTQLTANDECSKLKTNAAAETKRTLQSSSWNRKENGNWEKDTAATKAFRARKEKLVPGKPTLLPQPVASIFLRKALSEVSKCNPLPPYIHRYPSQKRAWILCLLVKTCSNCFSVIRGHIPDVFFAPLFGGVLNMGVQFFRMPLIFFDFPHHTKQEKKSERSLHLVMPSTFGFNLHLMIPYRHMSSHTLMENT